MPRTINDLSTEVLRQLLRHAKVNSSRERDATFLNTLTVCRLWYEIGHELLWTDVSLTGAQLVKFTRCPHPSSAIMRSLTIKAPVYPHEKADLVGHYETAIVYPPFTPPDICKALEVLPVNLRIMEKLESFSLVVPYAHGRKLNTEIHPLRFLGILLALPKSLRHLELDTNRLEGLRTEEAVHLCPRLSRLMGSLRNLRLRLRSVCKDIFASDAVELPFNVAPRRQAASYVTRMPTDV